MAGRQCKGISVLPTRDLAICHQAMHCLFEAIVCPLRKPFIDFFA